MERSSPEWDLDTNRVASVISTDLRDNRPNRWTGHPSQWRRKYPKEFAQLAGIKHREDTDLGVHLYNTLALKRRARDPATVQDVTITRVRRLFFISFNS